MTFTRQSFASLGLTTGYAAMMLAVSVLGARLMSLTEYGLYASVMGHVLILSALTSSLPQLLSREITSADRAGDDSLMLGLIRWSVGWVLLAGAFVLLAASAVAAGTGVDPIWWRAFLLGSGVLIGYGVLNVTGATLVALDRPITGQIPGSVLRPVLQIAGIVAVASLTTLTAERAILILLVASLLSVGVAVGLLRRRLTIPARTRPVFRGRIWARSLVLLSVMLLCQRIYQHLGTVALQYLGTPEEVALYQPAVEALILTTLPAVALTTILMPRMRAALVDGDRQLQQRLITNSGRLIALCTAGISTLLLALGPTGLALIFGPDFAAAYPAVAIIAVTQVLASLLGLPNVILAQADQERLVAWVMSGGVLLSILASLALIPRFGPLGAALATGITLIGVRFVLSWICRRHLGLETLITKSPQSGAEQVGKPGRSA